MPLARVMQQLKEAQNADLPSEQKLDQIQTLNTQAPKCRTCQDLPRKSPTTRDYHGHQPYRQYLE